ncbi:MAG: toll/interleukin-1 receptor domain-containing protein [Hyphomonas sp.]
MRQIYLLASDADEIAAVEIETLLRQRGYMVRRAEEKFAFPPARAAEVTLALWSKAVAFSSKQILFTNRAIDAWTEGRLVFGRLDHSLLPRGLGDVEAIDLSFEPARMAAVWKIVEAAQEIDRAMQQTRGTGVGVRPGGDVPPAPYVEEDSEADGEARGGAGFSASHAAIIAVVAAAAFASTGYISMPQAPHLLVGLAAILWGAVAGVAGGFLIARQESAGRFAAPVLDEPAAEEAAMLEQADRMEEDQAASGPTAVFVSYSRRDGEVVYPMVAEVEAAGRPVWIDKQDIEAGSNWAGLIVRAIRESDTFCLMCTAEAFQSDNVRREIYIANKYKRKMLPVRLDFAEMPEDFEYFLIDRQWLDLTAIDPAERAVRLTAALAR